MEAQRSLAQHKQVNARKRAITFIQGIAMKKWNMVIDVALCENCNNCALVTKDEHIGNDFPGYAAPQPSQGHDWIRIERRVRGRVPMVDTAYLPTMCNHCDAAPCIAAAKDGAIYQRTDGIVIIDPQKARGRKDLVDAAPTAPSGGTRSCSYPKNGFLMPSCWTRVGRCRAACRPVLRVQCAHSLSRMRRCKRWHAAMNWRRWVPN